MSNDTWPLHNIGNAVVASMQKWERKEADVYPTPADVSQCLLDNLHLPRPIRIREPGCGDGDMVRVFQLAGHTVERSDIRYTGFNQFDECFDYLTTPLPRIDAVFMNPPFKDAAAFIRKAIGEAPLVAVLLKSNYWHTKRGLPLFHYQPPALELKLTWRPAFLKEERGNNPLMDCSWYIWRQQGGSPTWRPVARPKLFPNIDEKPLTVRLVKLAEALELNARARAREQDRK